MHFSALNNSKSYLIIDFVTGSPESGHSSWWKWSELPFISTNTVRLNKHKVTQTKGQRSMFNPSISWSYDALSLALREHLPSLSLNP